MGPARWREVQEVLLRAIDLQGSDRDDFLDGRCGTDPRLRAEVEALIAADRTRDRVLDATLEDLLGMMDERRRGRLS